ncbi:TPA: hypothetical protein ACNEZX_005288 [Escherichia coli]
MILSVFITVISGHDKPQPSGCLLDENVIEPEKFNYIMGDFDKCDKFFYSVLELYNSNENQELLIEEIVNLCSKIANERSDILEKLYEKSKDYLPYSYN